MGNGVVWYPGRNSLRGLSRLYRESSHWIIFLGFNYCLPSTYLWSLWWYQCLFQAPTWAAGLLVRVFGFHEVLSMALLNFQQVLPERHRVSPNKSILSLLASASLLQVLDFFRMGLQVAPWGRKQNDRRSKMRWWSPDLSPHQPLSPISELVTVLYIETGPSAHYGHASSLPIYNPITSLKTLVRRDFLHTMKSPSATWESPHADIYLPHLCPP